MEASGRTHPDRGVAVKRGRRTRAGDVLSRSVTAYTLGDVARICKVSPERLRYWEKTALLGDEEACDAERAYGFDDLVSVRSVLGLLADGVPLRRIRRGVEAVRTRLPEVEQPLRALRKRSDGSGRLVVRDGDRLMEPDGQLLLGFGDVETPAPAPAPPAPTTTPAWHAHARRAAEAWFERGCALDSERATYAEAIDAYQRAIEIAPEFADAYCNLGSVYFNQGRRTPARECFERALAIDPTHLEANLNLATLEEEVGRDAVALRHYRAALETDPMRADAHVTVALPYEKLRARSKAGRQWRFYLQLDPAGLWADIARRPLEEAGD